MRKPTGLATALAVVLVVALSAVLSQAPACSGRRRPGTHAQRMVILGFDGLDPTLTAKWMKEGKLPNMKRLADRGGMMPLATTQSPESPTAWASFATGVNPGKHNIYDFLVRDTATYLPDLGMVRREPGRFLFDYLPIARPKLTSLRGGTSFWVTAGRAGVRSSILTVPVTFPPEDVPNGELLSGLPLPGHSRHDGDVPLLRDRLEPIRGRQHRVRRRPQAAAVRATISPHAELLGPPNPIVQAADPQAENRADDRGGPGHADGHRGERGRARAVHDSLESREPVRHRRDPGSVDSADDRQDEPLDSARVPNQFPRADPRDGAAAADEGRRRVAAVRVAGQLDAGPSTDADVVACVVLGRTVRAPRATTGRSAGPKRPGR